jgi:hypothetical protein
LYAAAAGSSESEFYFYIAPSINYQLYDATIQEVCSVIEALLLLV